MNGTKTITVRAATAADIDDAVEVARLARGEEWTSYAAAHCLSSGRWHKDGHAGLWFRCWLAFVDCVPAGICWGTESMTALRIEELCVAPAFRRMLVGTSLLMEAELLASAELIPTLVVCRLQDRLGVEWLRRRWFYRMRRASGELLAPHLTGAVAAVFCRATNVVVSDQP